MKKGIVFLIIFFLNSCSSLPSMSPDTLKVLQLKQATLDFNIESNPDSKSIKIKVQGEGYLRFLSQKKGHSQFLQEAEVTFNEKGKMVLLSEPDLLMQPTIQALTNDSGDAPNLQLLKLCKNGKILYKNTDEYVFISILSLLVFPDSTADQSYLYQHRQFIESRPIGNSDDTDCMDKTQT